jgi:hypothetical protein
MKQEEGLMLEMKVKGLARDPLTNTPIIILKDLAEERALLNKFKTIRLPGYGIEPLL